MENYVSIGEVKLWTTICDQVDSNKPYLCLCGYTINYDALNTGLRSFNDYVKRATLYRDISQLRVPTIILYGEDDIRPPWPAIQLSHLLPNCTMSIFAGTGHFIWLDKPNEFTESITRWLEEVAYT